MTEATGPGCRDRDRDSSESGVEDRRAFTQGIDELQAAMLVIPSEVLYEPKFTWEPVALSEPVPDADLEVGTVDDANLDFREES